MKKSMLLTAVVGLLLLGIGCADTQPQPNNSSAILPPASQFSDSSSPADVYSGFTKLSFGRAGNKNSYAVAILGPNQSPNTDPENGLVISDSNSSCIKKNQKVSMDQLISLDRFFVKPDFWNLSDTLSSQQSNADQVNLFIEIDSDAGKKKVIVVSGSNEVFDGIFNELQSVATKPGCMHVEENYIPASGTRTYRNTVDKYTLVFPQGWMIPASARTDSHFYENNNEDCILAERGPDCVVFEIQKHDLLSTESEQQIIDRLVEDGQHPVKIPALIKDAVIIKAESAGGAEGYSFEYSIFFKNKALLVVLTNDDMVTEKILTTLRLL